ncbi:twin-arginine translocation signal domain-containing protein [Streptomyces sp. AcE210]|uniref:twin-arginine translocation signal domain-containing protein n=1 Tax=Streptomyces sp. AcE210 TaxID=2292703 RepID=UPI000E306026|nr:twin-arginine translocation signal domain-containing protein [Streptomyces sp. AcE210]RFC76698.1 hypothetical protein DXZ75_01160 [Streptomyces sp. AcE210]
MGKPTRRDLLKGAGALGAAAIVDGALGASASAQARPLVQERPEQATTVEGEHGVLDVAVVGAGVSGRTPPGGCSARKPSTVAC